MTDTRQLPPARPRTRRVIAVDDSVPTPAPARRPAPDEGQFDYGEAFSGNPAIRYRQIKAVEGRAAAKAFAKAQMIRLSFSGVSVQEIAQTFGFSTSWTDGLLSEARREVREKAASGFDGLNIVAEHMMLYRSLRENAFFTMNKGAASEVDRHRARESLLSIMRNEIEFVDRVGGLRGVSLHSDAEDESVRAAREMAGRINTLTEQLEEIMSEELEDYDAPAMPGDEDVQRVAEEAAE